MLKRYPRGFSDGEYQDGELRGITFWAGVRGMGKTTDLDRSLSTCSGGVLFFDSISKHEGVFKGYTVFHQPGPLRDYLLANRGRRFRVMYVPKNGDPTKHFRLVCRIVRIVGWMVFAIDELDFHCGPEWGDKRMPPELDYLVNYGRHCRVAMCGTARYPQTVARGFISQWENIRLFNISDEEQVKYFKKLCGSRSVDGLEQLPKYKFLLCSKGQTAPVVCGGER